MPIPRQTLIPFAGCLHPTGYVHGRISLFLTAETHPSRPLCLFLFRSVPLPPPLCSPCWTVTRLYSNPPPRADKRTPVTYTRANPPPSVTRGWQEHACAHVLDIAYGMTHLKKKSSQQKREKKAGSVFRAATRRTRGKKWGRTPRSSVN